MSLLAKIRQIEKYADIVEAKESVRFFSSQAEFDQAEKSGTIKDNTICFINDFGEDDE